MWWNMMMSQRKLLSDDVEGRASALHFRLAFGIVDSSVAALHRLIIPGSS